MIGQGDGGGLDDVTLVIGISAGGALVLGILAAWLKYRSKRRDNGKRGGSE